MVIHHRKQLSLLRACDIFCAPSFTPKDGDVEGIPNALKEAVSTGLPVISTFHAGIPELITAGTDGILVKEGSADSLAQALEYLLANPQMWEKFGKAAREKIMRQFHLETQLQRQAAFYEEIV